jgi:IS30 family transposase
VRQETPGRSPLACDDQRRSQTPLDSRTSPRCGLTNTEAPKGSDLSVHSEADLDAVAIELNGRPRKRLEFRKPIEDIGPLLLQ